MPTVRDTSKLLDLQRKIENLSPADKLRVAADCIEHGQYDIAETLAGRIVDELRAVRILKRSQP